MEYGTPTQKVSFKKSFTSSFKRNDNDTKLA